MEENYLIGLVIAFLFSFVLLKKDEQIPESDVKKYRKTSDDSRDTGVAKYLKNQEGDVSSEKVTGVAKYLQDKELLDVDNDSSSVSSVAKYLANKAETPVSGVSKYMARQVIQSRKIAKENMSGVEKYLNNH